MRYLIDTCVLSELQKSVPNGKVISWITKNDEENFYLSVLTLGELHKGICKLPKSKRKNTLHYWVEHDLKDRFKNRIIDINIRVAKVWGEIVGKSESQGYPMPAIDSLIAATALAYDLIVVTRNITDMQPSECSLIDPWE